MTDAITTKPKAATNPFIIIAAVIGVAAGGYGGAKYIEHQEAEDLRRAQLTATVNADYDAMMERRALKAGVTAPKRRDRVACADAMDRANAAARVNDSDASIRAQTDMLRTCGI